MGSGKLPGGEWKVETSLSNEALFVNRPSMIDKCIDNFSIDIYPFLAREI